MNLWSDRKRKIIFVVVAVLFAFAPFQNCGEEGFQSVEWASQKTGICPEDVPESQCFSNGFVAPSCLSSDHANYNACVIFKNPVAQNGAPLNPSIALNTEDLGRNPEAVPQGIYNRNDLVTWAVNIPSETVVNASFDIKGFSRLFEVVVETGNSYKYQFKAPEMDPTVAVDGQFKFGTQGEDLFRLVDVNVFYWLNHQLVETKKATERMRRGQKVSGVSFLENKSVKVYTTAPFERFAEGDAYNINAFWSGTQKNLIVLGVGLPLGLVNDLQTNPPLGLASEVVLHEAGHAHLDYAAMQDVVPNDILEKYCNDQQNSVCSRSINGSPISIHEGVGDVHAYLIFPDSTAVGELMVNDLYGLGHCQQPRDVSKVKSLNLSAEDLFRACEARDESPGEVHALGTVYATIWFGILERARSLGEESYKEAKALFFEHLRLITSGDDFLTIKEATLVLDQRDFGGRFSSFIELEYASMGY